MRMLYLLVFIFCMPILAVADVQVSFDNAAELYREGKYQQAIVVYEDILEKGQESGALYYNLGNAYFKLDELGKAVLYYEKAMRLIPRDPDLKSNLDYARSFVKGDQGQFDRTLLKRFMPHSHLFTQDEITYLVLILLFVCTIFILWIIKQSSSIPAKVLWSLLAIGVLAFHVIVLFYKVQEEKYLAIVLKKTEAKFEPVNNATMHYHLPEGGKIRILKYKHGWIKVERADGKQGWLPEDVAAEI